MLTRYAMRGFELVEELPRRPGLSSFSVLDVLTDTFRGLGSGGDVKQALIGFRVLDDSCRPPVYRKNDGTLALLKLLQEIARTAPEVGQGLDVARDVKHKPAHVKHLFRC
jgi:hypothetical protein